MILARRSVLFERLLSIITFSHNDTGARLTLTLESRIIDLENSREERMRRLEKIKMFEEIERERRMAETSEEEAVKNAAARLLAWGWIGMFIN